MSLPLPDYKYSYTYGSMVSEDLLRKFSELYSAHYGVWSKNHAKRPGKRIRLSTELIRTWLQSKDSKVAYATLNENLVGYAMAVQTKVPNWGMVSWGTQLVVHEEHRQNGVGKQLLFAIWGLSDHYAWGVLTPNPYAIRALEKATRRRCSPQRIRRNYKKLVTLGAKHVPYVADNLEVEVNDNASRAFTNFFVDHSDLEEMMSAVTTEDKPWGLGEIEEGWEWFAFTFNDQEQLELTASEIHQMVDTSDQVARVAYSRMLEQPPQPWAKFTEQEADLILRVCQVAEGGSLLDLGCGAGRHAFALAKRGVHVTGVDYLTTLIEKAQKEATQKDLPNLDFVVGDCRKVTFERQFDAAICLYDVVGTYADNVKNLQILENICRHLKPGGRALISVMNVDLIRRKATKVFSFEENPQELLQLPASQVMEKSGNVFDPKYFLLDEVTNVVYRREQFVAGSNLPIELIVRDRRFTGAEIIEMCNRAGLGIKWIRYVNAGSWDKGLTPKSDKAKEILICCDRSGA